MPSLKDNIKKRLNAITKKCLPFVAAAFVSIPSTSLAKRTNLLEFDITYLGYEENFVSRVSNIPLEIRDVPRHPDDWYARDSNVAPISKDNLTLYAHIPLEVRTGLRVPPSEKFRAIIGVGGSMELDAANPFKVGYEKNNFVERNYTNAPGTSERGYGAALTYYTIGTDFFRVFAFSEFEYVFNQKISVAVGGRIFEDHVKAENGWDRYDHTETRKKYRLADLSMGEPYLSFRVHTEKDDPFAVCLEIGKQKIINRQLVGLGRETNIEFKESPLELRIRAIGW